MYEQQQNNDPPARQGLLFKPENNTGDIARFFLLFQGDQGIHGHTAILTPRLNQTSSWCLCFLQRSNTLRIFGFLGGGRVHADDSVYVCGGSLSLPVALRPVPAGRAMCLNRRPTQPPSPFLPPEMPEMEPLDGWTGGVPGGSADVRACVWASGVRGGCP